MTMRGGQSRGVGLNGIDAKGSRGGLLFPRKVGFGRRMVPDEPDTHQAGRKVEGRKR